MVGRVIIWCLIVLRIFQRSVWPESAGPGGHPTAG